MANLLNDSMQSSLKPGIMAHIVKYLEKRKKKKLPGFDVAFCPDKQLYVWWPHDVPAWHLQQSDHRDRFSASPVSCPTSIGVEARNKMLWKQDINLKSSQAKIFSSTINM